MEITGALLLYALAGLMVTFAGFSALLLGIRQAAGAHVSLLDRYLARTVLTNTFVLTGGALLPPLLALYGVSESWIWRGSALLFGLPLLLLLLTYPRRRRKVVGTGPPLPIFAVLVVVGSVVLTAMLVYVCAGLKLSAAVYVTGLVVNFFTLAFAFVTALDIVMLQPTE